MVYEMFAKTYGWTLDHCLDLTNCQKLLYLERMNQRAAEEARLLNKDTKPGSGTTTGWQPRPKKEVITRPEDLFAIFGNPTKKRGNLKKQ